MPKSGFSFKNNRDNKNAINRNMVFRSAASPLWPSFGGFFIVVWLLSVSAEPAKIIRGRTLLR
ncbi:MAG TPA: hypothetical protein PLI15_14740, partial [Anaerolineales bacterium]|nr:hypothetical protein [Anaerolineales bacterium]HMZ44307.1 hypothetical protein [Anaerolineales bacterium]HNB85997.1 hypothetical protein [Anaerolineales bacterium]HND91149.1 hypothetical protein [Anaerolineales bacterium]HNF35997.1 hypothetical protein [Anaerolineales bacterium]